MSEKSPGSVMLRNVRLSFPSLWKPTASVESNEPKLRYRASYIIDPNTPDGKKNIEACKAAVRAVEMEALPSMMKNGYREPEYDINRKFFRKPGEGCRNKTTGEIFDGFEGMWHVKTTGERKPRIVDLNPNRELTEADGRPYPGCYVNALVNFYVMSPSSKDKGGLGLFASTSHVQFFREGEAFGVVFEDAASVFDDLSGADAFDDMV